MLKYEIIDRSSPMNQSVLWDEDLSTKERDS